MDAYGTLLPFNPSWTKARHYGGFTYTLPSFSPSWTKARLYRGLLIIRQTPDFLFTDQILGNWALNKGQTLWVIYWSLGKRQNSCSLIRHPHIGMLPDFNRGTWTFCSLIAPNICYALISTKPEVIFCFSGSCGGRGYKINLAFAIPQQPEYDPPSHSRKLYLQNKLERIWLWLLDARYRKVRI